MHNGEIKSFLRKKEETLCGKTLEHLKCFNNLGTIIEQNGKVDSEINERLGKTGRLKKVENFFRKKGRTKRNKNGSI